MEEAVAGYGIRRLVSDIIKSKSKRKSNEQKRNKVLSDLRRHFSKTFANLASVQVKLTKSNGEDVYRVEAYHMSGDGDQPPYVFHVVVDTGTYDISLYMGPDAPET